MLMASRRIARNSLWASHRTGIRCAVSCNCSSDDPRSPNYNRHIVIDPKDPPENYTHEKMRSGDFAYHWLVEIRHNSDPPVPGAGSAIFFHIRRGVNRATTGCTTMAEPELVK